MRYLQGNRDLRCVLGWHRPGIVLNTKNNRIVEICTRCKEVLRDAKPEFCCARCLAADMNWKKALREQGLVICV